MDQDKMLNLLRLSAAQMRAKNTEANCNSGVIIEFQQKIVIKDKDIHIKQCGKIPSDDGIFLFLKVFLPSFDPP